MLRGIKLLGASGFVWAVGLGFLPRALLLRVALGGSLRLGRGLVAGLWILLATGGGSILQGLGCSPSVEFSVGT